MPIGCATPQPHWSACNIDGAHKFLLQRLCGGSEASLRWACRTTTAPAASHTARLHCRGQPRSAPAQLSDRPTDPGRPFVDRLSYTPIPDIARHAHHPSHPPSSIPLLHPSRSFIPATPATFRSDSPTLPKALDSTAASARCPHKNAPRVKQRTSVMSGKFRLHPEPGTERHAPFRLGSAIYNTIRTGGLGSGLLVPHVLLPIYGIYVVTHRSGYWTPEFERGLTFAIALLQGVSFGSAIALSIVRYSASGKAIKGRRIEKTATDSEESSQHRIEVALRASIYLFVATMLWEYLVHSKFSPITDEQARHTSSGFLTATGPLRRFLSNESILPQPDEVRDQVSGLGLNLEGKANDLHNAIKNSPRIHVPGTQAPPKSLFLRAYQKVWYSVTGGPSGLNLGLFEIGPNIRN
ncbi:hypothetical protein PaG_04976 [Moesziomyces aphidis]|uniref:Uncharacterized protein n=1 Tax=Moesziomyces aphidis TaxID=84754 RepID=W3VHA3_MOEAP|nr:hypothetical protein PaG_04976 [Moesziomyces aphidis]